jgi:hypothetical protein
MSRFSEYFIAHQFDEWGDLQLNESVTRAQILNAVELVMKLNKILPTIIDEVSNEKWAEYLTRFHKKLAIVGDILLRK